jgi:hypothetical protein
MILVYTQVSVTVKMSSLKCGKGLWSRESADIAIFIHKQSAERRLANSHPHKSSPVPGTEFMRRLEEIQ